MVLDKLEISSWRRDGMNGSCCEMPGVQDLQWVARRHDSLGKSLVCAAEREVFGATWDILHVKWHGNSDLV